MLKRLLASAALMAWASIAAAQNYIAPTPPAGDKSNRIATTAFVGSVTNLPSPFTIGTSLYPVLTGFEYNANSAFGANTIGAKSVMVGVPAATSSCCTWLNTYLSGVDVVGIPMLYSIHPGGTASLWTTVTAARSSDSSAVSAQNIIPSNCVEVHDNTSVAHLNWCGYDATYITSGAAHSRTLGREISIFNTGTASTAEDPFNVNPTVPSSEGLRVDCAAGGGFGGNDCGAAYSVVNNGAKFISGINFQSSSLDTSVNLQPPAIQLPVGYAVKWYSGAATVAGFIYMDSFSVTNGGSQDLASGAGRVTVHDITDNAVADYYCSSNTCTLGSSNGSIWVASTTTPAAGKMSVAFDAGNTLYAVYNNQGGTVTVHIAATWTKSSP